MHSRCCSQVCQFNNATCGVFQALAQRGYLSATVQNTGAISGGYYVQVGSPPHGSHVLLMAWNMYTNIHSHALLTVLDCECLNAFILTSMTSKGAVEAPCGRKVAASLLLACSPFSIDFTTPVCEVLTACAGGELQLHSAACECAVHSAGGPGHRGADL